MKVSPAAVDKMVEAGIPRAKRGQSYVYTWQSEAWYWKRRALRAEQQQPSALEAERARKMKVEADMAEIRRNELLKRMVSVDVVEREHMRIFDLLRARWLAVPGRDAPRHVGIRSYGEARTRLEDYAHQILAEAVRSADEIEGGPIPQDGDARPDRARSRARASKTAGRRGKKASRTTRKAKRR